MALKLRKMSACIMFGLIGKTIKFETSCLVTSNTNMFLFMDDYMFWS
jgi:hypothetical protein